MKEFIKKNKYLILTFVIVFLFTLTFPFTGDDITWSMKDLSLASYIDVIRDSNINGRYLGNLLVIIMTRNKILRSLIASTVLIGIVHLIKKETSIHEVLIWLLLILMPIEIFVQGIVWTSGFANYAISSFLCLLCLKRIRSSYRQNNDNKTIITNFLIFLISSFFMENITIFLLIFSLVMFLIDLIKNKKANLSLFSCFLGSLLGTTFMFIHPAYMNVLNTTDKYRTLNFGLINLIFKSIENYNFIIYKYAIFQSGILSLILNVLLILYFMKNKQKYTHKKFNILKITFTISTLFTIYTFSMQVLSYFKDFALQTSILNARLTLMYLCILITQIIMLFYKQKSFWKLIMPIIVSIGLIIPLLIVSPIGPRNFLLIYILELLEVAYLIKEADLKVKKIKVISTILLIIIAFSYASMYSFISTSSKNRDNYIKNISENTSEVEIKVPTLPFPKFVHFPSYNTSEDWKKNYLKYLKVRENLSLIYVPYEEWNSIKSSK